MKKISKLENANLTMMTIMNDKEFAMYISSEDFEKFEYLVGFVNTVAEIVCDPEEMLDPNTGDSTVFAIGYSVDDDTVELSTLEDDTVEDFRENLAALESEIKLAVRKDFSKEWQKLQG